MLKYIENHAVLTWWSDDFGAGFKFRRGLGSRPGWIITVHVGATFLTWFTTGKEIDFSGMNFPEIGE